MHWLSFMYGGLPDDGDFCGFRRKVRYRSGKVCILWHMRINLSGFGNCTGTIVLLIQKQGRMPHFLLQKCKENIILCNTK